MNECLLTTEGREWLCKKLGKENEWLVAEKGFLCNIEGPLSDDEALEIFALAVGTTALLEGVLTLTK